MAQTLTPKSPLPDLDLPLVGGGQFKPTQSDVKDFQILVFYRGLHCPKCKDHLRDIDSQFKDLSDQGLSLTAISMDSQERAEQTKADWGIEHLPIAYGLGILDAKAYGLFLSDKREGSDEPALFSEPAIMVAKPDGALYAQYIQNTPFGRPPMKDIAAGLAFVKKHDYPTRGTSVA